MSNNIYDILKKMQSLETPKANLTESKGSKPDFLDMDKDGDTTEPMKKAAKEKSKGAVAEAVAQVERQLNEKYQGFKKMNEGNQLPAPPDEVHLPKKGSKHGPVDVYKPNKNEDMLSPGQKKIAQMSPPPDKIDANDLKALRAGKDKKKEGNAFSGAMANAKASGQDEFKVGGKEYAVKEGSPKKKTQSPDEKHKVVAGVRDAMRKGYDNVQKGRDERAAARFVAKLKYGINDSEKTNEGFPTVADAEKRMREKEGKTAHGKKTTTAAGTRHERDYDAVDKGADVDMTPKGRGRPKKDRFAQ